MKNSQIKNIDIKIETKELNEIFYVYKDTQIFVNETRVFYGLCFHDEVENFKENLIFPEAGSKILLINKEIPPELKILTEENKNEYEKYCFPLEDFFNDEISNREINKRLLAYTYAKIENNQIIFYDYNLDEPYPLNLFSLYDKTIGITDKDYEILKSTILLENNPQIINFNKVNYENENITRLEFDWLPNDEEWILFLSKLLKYDKNSAIKFVADKILKLPQK